MLRRGIGVGGLQRQKVAAEHFKVVGGEMAENQLEQMKRQFALFQSNLEEFAKKHRKAVSKNPQFRQYFNEMCQKVGVDPLASQRGFWAQMLGVGDFYYELGIQIIDVCMRTREGNGGIIELGELKTRLIKHRGPKAQEVSTDDIERAIKKLKTLGGGFNLISIGSKKLVQSVACELSSDHTTTIVLAQDKGFVTSTILKKELGWDENRIDRVMALLLNEGMAWVDNQSVSGDGNIERSFWFPSVSSAVNLD